MRQSRLQLLNGKIRAGHVFGFTLPGFFQDFAAILGGEGRPVPNLFDSAKTAPAHL